MSFDCFSMRSKRKILLTLFWLRSSILRLSAVACASWLYFTGMFLAATPPVAHTCKSTLESQQIERAGANEEEVILNGHKSFSRLSDSTVRPCLAHGTS